MARCKLGLKKVAKLKRETGLDIVTVFMRGGTDHRKDLILSNGKTVHLFKDGSIKYEEELEY